MAMINLRLGGGGSTSNSDDCTATASQVLTGVTAITKDSNDEPIQGTMPSQNQMTFNSSWWDATSGLGARMNPAYAASADGNNPYIYVPPANVRSTLGIAANNIRQGVSIAGVTGTLVDYGASRTVFNNGTFDGVLVSGMSQNWVTYRNTCKLSSYPVDRNIAIENISETMKNGTGTYIVGVFNYAWDMTPFKSVTVTVKNYGTAFFSTSSTNYSQTGIGCYVLDVSGAKVASSWQSVGKTTYSNGTQQITRAYSATFDMSSYNGIYGLVYATCEIGAYSYYSGFRLTLQKVTFNA